MLIHSISVTNFRQLAGKSNIVCARPGRRNVTVILGENGAGKSTLLNAFRWCLYGTVELENPNQVLSHRAVYEAAVGDRVSVEVVLQFEHRGVKYTAIRFREYQKREGGEAEPIGEEVFQLSRMASNGESETLHDPIGFVANLLPENLARFFFFQGESILQLALQRSREDLKEGVETFLDFKVLDRAVKHLSVVERAFEKDLRAGAKDEVVAMQDEIDAIKSEIDRVNADCDNRRQALRVLEGNLEEKKRRLAEVKALQPLLAEVSVQEQSITAKRAEKNGLEAQFRRRLSQDGFLALCSAVLDVPRELAEAAVEKGDLPASIKPGFVDDVIARGECICGRSIDAHAKERLARWREVSGIANLEAAIDVLRKTVDRYESVRKMGLLADCQSLQLRMAELLDDIRVAQEKKSRAEHALSGVEIDESDIEELRDSCDRDSQEIGIHRAHIEIGEGQRAEARNRLKRKEAERSRLLDRIGEEQVLGERIAAARNVGEALQQIRQDWTTFVQQHLDGLLKESWTSVAQLPRNVSFTDDFALTIEEKGGGGGWVRSAPSEANCCVLALTFVAALIQFADEIGNDKQRHSVFDGGEYPIVMDAPFAKMDEEFKRRVPIGLAQVVPQVIVISNIDQWRGEVSASMEGRVGKGYVLSLHKPGSDQHVRRVEAFGQQIEYVITDDTCDVDWSEIQEVSV